MKRDSDKKTLSLDTETLRVLDARELETVAGGEAQQAMNLSIFCQLSKAGNCTNSFLGVCGGSKAA